VQHPGLLLQHRYTTLATYTFEISETFETYSCNIQFSPFFFFFFFFHMPQHRAVERPIFGKPVTEDGGVA
jgi:hypothetical protein